MTLRVGSWTVTATDVTLGTVMANTSPTVQVVLGTFVKLQVLLPGETAAPGTASGKTGTPAPQVVGVSFDVVVNAVDANWDVVNSGDTVHLASTDTYAVLPVDTALVAGTKTFSVTLKTAGSKTITASDITNPPMTGAAVPPSR